MANIEKPIWSKDKQTLTNVLVNNKSTTYNKVSNWYDGTPMDDSKLDDDFVYVKYEGQYLVRNMEEGQVLQKDSMDEMRNLSTFETLLLKMGIYKHVQLNGYYEKGDTPEPINYKISDTIEDDDGGSVIETNLGDKLEHTFQNELNILYFGITPSNTNSVTIQRIFDKYSSGDNKFYIHFNEGEYNIGNSILNIRSGINIIGKGRRNTVISGIGSLIRTQTNVNSLNIVGDLEKESTSVNIETGTDITAGDIILVESKRSMKEFWSDTIYDESKKHNQGEILKVKEVSVDGTEIVFEGVNLFNYKSEDIYNVSYFTPVVNCSVIGVSIKTEYSDEGGSIGLDINYCDSFKADDILTENFNVAGVRVQQSMYVDIGNVYHLGGSDVVGQNYGTLVYNGSKYCNIKRVTGRRTRHTFAGSSDGRGVPMYNQILEVVHYEDNKEEDSTLHGVDTHYATAYFTFGNLYSENGISVNGLRHTIDNSFNIGGNLFIQYNGGQGLKINNYQHINPKYESRSSAEDAIIKDVYVDNLTIKSNGNSFRDQVKDMRIFRRSEGVIINNLHLENLDSDNYLDGTEATDNSYRDFLISDPIKINNLFIKGYGSIRINSSYVSLSNVTMVDCGWTESHSISSLGAITLGKDSNTPLHNISLKNITFENRNKNLDFGGTFIRVLQSLPIASDIIIDDVKYKVEEEIFNYIIRINISSPTDNFILKDISLQGNYSVNFDYENSNVSIINCKYLNEYRFPIEIGQSGQILTSDGTGLVKWKTFEAPASSDSSSAVGSEYSQSEVQSILDELRDLKSKMRSAGLLES